MDYIHTLARATQKALVSAHNEFHRELYTPTQPTSQALSTTPTALTPSSSHIVPKTPSAPSTPTITQVELNQLRDALYKGKAHYAS